MKKYIFTLFFITVCGISFSQTKVIKGIVKDIYTQQPIESVSLSVSSGVFSISNSEGRFKINIPENSKELVFSHIMYKSYIQKTGADINEIEVFLEPQTYIIEEIVISGKSAKNILSDAHKNSQSELEKSVLLSTYYREFIKSATHNEIINEDDSEYTHFSDGLLDYHIKKNSNADLYVNQSRAINLVADSIDKKPINFLDVRKMTDFAYDMSEVKDILKSKYYDFEKEYRTDESGRGVYFISVIPKKEAKKELFEGTVIIDDESNRILDVDLKSSDEHLQYAFYVKLFNIKIKTGKSAFKISFKIDGDKYFLSYLKIYKQSLMEYTKKGKTTVLNIEGTNDLVVTKYEESIFKMDRNKRHKNSTLYKAGSNYKEEYWKFQNILVLTEQEQKILESVNQH